MEPTQAHVSTHSMLSSFSESWGKVFREQQHSLHFYDDIGPFRSKAFFATIHILQKERESTITTDNGKNSKV